MASLRRELTGRIIDRLVLAHEGRGHIGGETAEHTLAGIDDVPNSGIGESSLNESESAEAESGRGVN